MAVVNEPIFIQSSAIAAVQAITANTALDGTGTLVTLLTGDADGTLVKMVWAKGAAAVQAANMVRVFLSPDGGTNKRLVGEITLAAATSSGTVKTTEGNWKPLEPLVLKDTNHILYVAVHVGEAVNCFAFGAGNY